MKKREDELIYERGTKGVARGAKEKRLGQREQRQSEQKTGGELVEQQYVEFNNLGKAFPGVQALKDVSFRVEGGQVCALLGENGAGKSTLLKILSGDLQPDEGYVSINGKEQKFVSPYQAIKASISVIYQERQLVASLNVMENIFLEDLPSNKLGVINKAELRKRTQEIIDKFGLPLRPTEYCRAVIGGVPADGGDHEGVPA